MRLILEFDQIAANAELRVKGIWPKQFDDEWVVPHVTGLFIEMRLDDAINALDGDGERVTTVCEIGSEMSAVGEVRPTIFRFDAQWALNVDTAVGKHLMVPQHTGWIPTDLTVPAVLVEVDAISFAGSSSLSVITLVTIDWKFRTLSELEFAKLLLHTGTDLKDFHEMGRGLQIDTTLVERFRGLD